MWCKYVTLCYNGILSVKFVGKAKLICLSLLGKKICIENCSYHNVSLHKSDGRNLKYWWNKYLFRFHSSNVAVNWDCDNCTLPCRFTLLSELENFPRRNECSWNSHICRVFLLNIVVSEINCTISWEPVTLSQCIVRHVTSTLWKGIKH